MVKETRELYSGTTFQPSDPDPHAKDLRAALLASSAFPGEPQKCSEFNLASEKTISRVKEEDGSFRVFVFSFQAICENDPNAFFRCSGKRLAYKTIEICSAQNPIFEGAVYKGSNVFLLDCDSTGMSSGGVVAIEDKIHQDKLTIIGVITGDVGPAPGIDGLPYSPRNYGPNATLAVPITPELIEKVRTVDPGVFDD